MPDQKQVTCSYGKCQHSSKKMNVNADNVYYDKNSKRYYHKDCWKIKQDIILIQNIWREKVSKSVVNTALNRVLNKLIFENDCDPEFIIFALEDAIKRKAINYPAGLYYLVDDKRLIQAWNKKVATEKMKKLGTDFSLSTEDKREANMGSTFKANREKPSWFNSILGGGKSGHGRTF